MDDSPLPILECGDVIIVNAKFGKVLHVPSIGPNLLSIYCITHTNKKVEFRQHLWVIKNINDGFKVVASSYCNESDYTYKLGKSSSPPKRSGFIAMVANVNNIKKLWPRRLGHTKVGTLRHMSHLNMADDLSQLKSPNGVYEECMLGKHHYKSFPKDLMG